MLSLQVIQGAAAGRKLKEIEDKILEVRVGEGGSRFGVAEAIMGAKSEGGTKPRSGPIATLMPRVQR